MELIKVFITGGLICTIGQVLIDKTKITPGRVLTVFVVMGVILSAFGIYKYIIDFGGAGASVPISGFGHSLATGVINEINKVGFIGIFTGGVKATAAGIASAITFGFLASLIAKPTIK
ncbi:MAG: stage V sporulation protein AE [Clostridia bacterium]